MTTPSLDVDAFTCLECGVHAVQHRGRIAAITGLLTRGGGVHFEQPNDNYRVSICSRCKFPILWERGTVVYPIAVTAPEPAADMPSTVRDIYEEARRVDALSPRGAAGLLRLALQLLVDDLVPGKGQLNAKIGQLVAEGLPTSVQQAMDSVRVIGNGAVHPGQIEIAGSRKDSEVLYRLINFVVEKTITEPKEIEGIFDNLPESQREAIDRRDGKATGGE